MSYVPPSSLSYLLDALYFFRDNHLPIPDPRLTAGVVIPANNEEANIESSIESALNQSYKPEQIVVVDDGSEDDTLALARRYERNQNGYNTKIDVISHECPEGKAKSVMEGMSHLYTNIGVILDADTRLGRDFIKEIRKPFAHYKVQAVCGTVFSLSEKGETFSERIIMNGRLIEYLYGQFLRKRGQSNRNGLFTLAGCCTALRPSILKKVPIPDRTVTEDLDFTWELQERGYKTVYQPSAVSFTKEPKDLPAYWKQIGRWYSGNWQALFIHNKKLRKSKGLALTSILTALETIPFAAVWTGLPLIAYIDPLLAGSFLATDFAFVSVPLAYFGKKQGKLKEAMKSLPSYYLLRFINSAGVLYSFEKTLSQWARGKRRWSHNNGAESESDGDEPKRSVELYKVI